MTRPLRRVGLVALALTLPLLAAADAGESDLEKNARLLLRWKQDPEHYARLKRDYRAFLALPPERQAELRRLDQELRAQPPETQARLLRVLERYAAFVEGLPPADRQRVEAAHGKERLALVEQLHRRRWFEQLPYKLREELTNLPEEKRTKEVAKLVEEDRRRKRLLTGDVRKRPMVPGKAEPFPTRPTRLSDYPHEVVSFFEYHIRDRLTKDEQERLTQAEGTVGPLARLIVEFADKYPVLPPSENKVAPTTFATLPPEWRKALSQVKLDKKGAFRKELLPYEEKWPDFALAAVRVAQAEQAKDPGPLGASRPADYPPDVTPVVRRFPELKALEGKWPDHPLKLHDLARKAGVALPGLTLPGAKRDWDALTREP